MVLGVCRQIVNRGPQSEAGGGTPRALLPAGEVNTCTGCGNEGVPREAALVGGVGEVGEGGCDAVGRGIGDLPGGRGEEKLRLGGLGVPAKQERVGSHGKLLWQKFFGNAGKICEVVR